MLFRAFVQSLLLTVVFGTTTAEAAAPSCEDQFSFGVSPKFKTSTEAKPALELEQLLQSVVITDYNPPIPTSAEWFRSPRRNQQALSRKSDELIEVGNLPVRKQCFDTCYLYATQTPLQTALWESGAIGPDDYLINLAPLIEVARQNYSEKRPQHPRLRKLFSGGNIQGFKAAATPSINYVLDAKSLAEVGGPQGIARLELQVLWDLISLEDFEGADSNSLESLLQMESDRLAEKAMGLLEREMAHVAGKPIQLKAVPIADIEVEVVYPARFSLSSAGAKETKGVRRYSWTGSAKNLDLMTLQFEAMMAFTRSSSSFRQSSSASAVKEIKDFRSILKGILDSLSRRQAVFAGVNGLFFDDSEDDFHAISIVGPVIERKTKILKGFKFLNSWGPEKMADGYGYISRDQLESAFEMAIFIQSLKLPTP